MSGSLLTTKQVAEMLSVSERTVLRWINTQQLEGIRLSPRVIRVPVASLRAFTGGSPRQQLSTGGEDPEEASRCEPRSGRSEQGGVSGADEHLVTEETLRQREALREHLADIERLVEEYGYRNPRVAGDVVHGTAWDWSYVYLLVEDVYDVVDLRAGRLIALLMHSVGLRFYVQVAYWRDGELHRPSMWDESLPLREFCAGSV